MISLTIRSSRDAIGGSIQIHKQRCGGITPHSENLKRQCEAVE